jgi:hypothetical protein
MRSVFHAGPPVGATSASSLFAAKSLSSTSSRATLRHAARAAFHVSLSDAAAAIACSTSSWPNHGSSRSAWARLNAFSSSRLLIGTPGRVAR